jgi:hypothetical protein
VRKVQDIEVRSYYWRQGFSCERHVTGPRHMNETFTRLCHPQQVVLVCHSLRMPRAIPVACDITLQISYTHRMAMLKMYRVCFARTITNKLRPPTLPSPV